MPPTTLSAGLLGAAAAALFAPPGAAPARAEGGDPTEMEKVLYDAPDAQGRLSGGMMMVPLEPPGSVAGAFDATVIPIVENGPPSNRIDLIFVGDGYVESELDTYGIHVLNAFVALFDEEPFTTYQTLFNAYRVEVISNESGVDNDPTPGILRDTALDMGFWCNDIERLLCVSVSLAYQYANNAPDVDQVLAVANSTKYGGAGYTTSNLATFSGGNGLATQVAIHEVGHSLGDLADEYDYHDGSTYAGPEVPERNVSALDASAMAEAGTKWANWLGDPGAGYGGPVSTYEGARYYEFGIYRPTANSMMRSLGQPFNLPSAEGLIIEMYKIVDPVDDATPPGQTLAGTETVFVDPVDPVGHDLDVEWTLDGATIPGAGPTTLDLNELGLDLGAHELAVTVSDPTPLVRDETARATWLTRTLTWDVMVALPGDIDGDFVVNLSDFLLLLSAWGPCGDPCPPACPGDFDGDCSIGVPDFLIQLANWS
jgi:hypothetical protein